MKPVENTLGLYTLALRFEPHSKEDNVKRFLTACFLLFSLLIGEAAYGNETDTSDYQPICNQGIYNLCGYHNKATFKRGEPFDWLIAPRFEAALPFSEGLAAVKIDGKFGFIDRSGKFQIKPTYDSVGLFYKGLAPYSDNGWIGFIDKIGKIIVPAQFSRAIPINDSTIIATDDPRYKNTSSNILPSLGNTRTPSLNLGMKSGIYNLKKGWMTEQKYFFNVFNEKNHDLLWAKEKRGNTGLMRSNGRWFKEPQYVGVASLKEDLAVVVVKQDNGTNLSGAVNKKGRMVIPAKFESLGSFNNGLATVSVEQSDGPKLWGGHKYKR